MRHPGPSPSGGTRRNPLALELLLCGAIEFGEPGLFMAFGETAEEAAQNVRPLGFEVEDPVRTRKLLVDYVHVERSEIEEAGEYDLEGLFIRLDHAISTIGATRVVLGTIARSERLGHGSEFIVRLPVLA